MHPTPWFGIIYSISCHCAFQEEMRDTAWRWRWRQRITSRCRHNILEHLHLSSSAHHLLGSPHSLQKRARRREYSRNLLPCYCLIPFFVRIEFNLHSVGGRELRMRRQYCFCMIRVYIPTRIEEAWLNRLGRATHKCFQRLQCTFPGESGGDCLDGSKFPFGYGWLHMTVISWIVHKPESQQSHTLSL